MDYGDYGFFGGVAALLCGGVGCIVLVGTLGFLTLWWREKW
ncbi:hypothetical protein [Verrucosispora sp. NA02020]|nr:hypothetical protein [Verrucosispora sp. NA02020]